jgi:hypothetical protein
VADATYRNTQAQTYLIHDLLALALALAAGKPLIKKMALSPTKLLPKLH